MFSLRGHDTHRWGCEAGSHRRSILGTDPVLKGHLFIPETMPQTQPVTAARGMTSRQGLEGRAQRMGFSTNLLEASLWP